MKADASARAVVIDGASVAEIAARIERLPVSRWHIRRLGVIGIAHFFDAFDALTIAFVLPVLAALWKLSPQQIGLAIALGYVGQAIGAICFGVAAEKFGRLRVLRWALLIISVFSFLSALSTGYVMFLVCRLIQGLGLGGEVPVAATYINEYCPGRSRGRVVLALQVLFATGVFLSAVVALWVIPNWGWQAMFFIGSTPIILALLLPRLAPESARWLAANGRAQEAEAIVSRVEADVASTGASLRPWSVELPGGTTQSSAPEQRWPDLLRPPLQSRTLTLWVMALCASLAGYGILSWMPTVATSVYHVPLELALSFGLAINFGAFVGNILALALIDKIGRRRTFALGYSGGGATLLTLALVGSAFQPATVMALAALAMLFLAIPLSSLYVYAPELYPTPVRAIGAGAASSCLRVGSIIGPIVVGYILPNYGLSSVFSFFVAACAIGAVAILARGPEMNGQPLV